MVVEASLQWSGGPTAGHKMFLILKSFLLALTKFSLSRSATREATRIYQVYK